MTERDRIISEIFVSQELAECIGRINPPHIRDDLKQHVFLLILEKPEDFILELNRIGKLKNYIVRVICQLQNFKEDKFHRVQRRATEILTDEFPHLADEENPEDVAVHCEKELQTLLQLGWSSQGETAPVNRYHGELLKRYIEKGNYRAVSEETGIPTKSVYNAVKQCREEIKKRVQCKLS